MKFSDPYMFYLVWAVFFLGGVMVYGSRKRGKILSRFAQKKELESIIPGYSLKRKYVKKILLILSLVFIVIALAGPLVGFRWEKIQQKGVDIMICLDCSRSMLAEDIKPDRLERAKHEIIDLLRMMKSDRAGLVAFAGDAVLECPLTMDYGAFHIFLNALSPDYLPVGGTDISGAIETALNGFEKNANSDKAIILITDGGNTSGDPSAAAEKAAKQGVKIFCIGVGSLDGAPVPDKNGGFIKDKNGRIVMSKVDDTGLKKIAAIANGRYVRSVAGNMDLDIIYTHDISKNMKKKTLRSTRRKIWENRFQWFLFPGLVLLLAELFIDERKKPKVLMIFLLIFSTMLFPFAGNCRAGAFSSVKKGIAAFSKGAYEKAEKNFIDAQLDRPELPQLYYDIGTAAYKKGDFKSALRNFKKALSTKKAGNKELREKARYNLANTEYKMGNLEKAIKDYEKVLKQNPKNKDAKENLEFVKKKLKQKNQKKDSSKNNKQKPDKKNNKTGKDKNRSDKQQQDKNKERRQKNKEKDKNQGGKKSRNKKNNQSGIKKSTPATKNKTNKNMNNTADNRIKQKNRKGKQNKINGSPLDRTQEMMLNRLKDEPGRAMIPAYRKRVIEKNW